MYMGRRQALAERKAEKLFVNMITSYKEEASWTP